MMNRRSMLACMHAGLREDLQATIGVATAEQA